jgi:nucleotide-binding universal stress UspA family protein
MAAERIIVVGVDGSPASVEALRWALRQATATASAVDVICACEPPSLAGVTPPVGLPPVVQPPVVGESALDSAQRRLDAVIGSVVTSAVPPGETSVAARVIEGHPADVLLQAAERADLLVVGRSGHGALMGILLGCIGSHVAAHAPCPVVVVGGEPATGRPGEHDAPDRGAGFDQRE